MRVLVVRPHLQARATAERLAALGHLGVVFPLFEPVHDVGLCSEALRTRYTALAISSAEAVRCLMRLGPALEPYLGRTVFAVGRATARLVREAGFEDVVVAAGNGRDLAALVAHHVVATDSDAPVLYLAGERRSGAFERTLSDSQIPCVTAEIYAMREIAYTIEEQQAILVNEPVDAAFLFSRENAKAFFALDVYSQSRAALERTLFFCLSHNIAEAVPEEFKRSVVVSTSPDEDALLELL
jgi:uroporphyrinogen-III synthase